MRRNAKSEQIGQNSVYYHRLLLAGLTFKGDSVRPPPPPPNGRELFNERAGRTSAPEPSTTENTPASSMTSPAATEWKLCTTWFNLSPMY